MGHAVRWASRTVAGINELAYGKWHWTEDANVTLCGSRIRLGIDGGSFLPDTDDDPARVDCKRCKRVSPTRLTPASQP
jgi:hypothetical protein